MLRIIFFSTLRLSFLGLVISFIIYITSIYSCYAMQTDGTINYFNLTLKDPSISKEKAFSFKADNISYNAKLNILIAIGNIEIEQNGNIIKADEAYIEKDKQYILAKGNIYLKDNYNKEVFADQIEIQNSFNNAIIENIQMLFSDDSLLSANAVVKNGNLINTYNASYTACPFGKFFQPFWSIKATKITYNQEKHIIRIYNGWLQIKSIPVMWIPYASYSDPKVKRRWGILNPHLGKNSVLGYYYTQPIFFPISKHTDLTLKYTHYQPNLPFFPNKNSLNKYFDPLLQADYLSYIKNGEINLKGSIVPNNLNWAIFSNFQNNLSDIFRIEGTFNNASSRNFLTLYKINNYSNKESFLWQNLKLESFLNNKDYFQLNISRNKNINLEVNKINSPYILPNMIFKHFGHPHKIGSFNVDIRYTNFLIENGYDNPSPAIAILNNFDLQKLSLQLNHNLTKITPLGVYSLDTQIQNVNYYKMFMGYNKPKKDIFDAYMAASFAAKAEYPIITTLGKNSSILNPIIQYSYASTFLKKKHNIIYLDPTTFNINILNLFENNKYNGFDSYNNGNRFNYALQWDLINTTGIRGQMLVGQSVDFSKKNKSNVLIYLALHPSPYIKINYTSSISANLKHFEQNNLSLYLGTNLLGTYLSYRSINPIDYNIYNAVSLEELQPTLYVRLTKNLLLNSSATFNLKNKNNSSIKTFKHLHSFDSVLIWENSCFNFSIKISRTFYGDLEIKPSNSYQFAFALKNIGGNNVKNHIKHNYNVF